MNIKQLKAKTGIRPKDIAKMFGLTQISFQNSSARKRYEKALCEFYEFLQKQPKKEKD